MKQLVTLFLFVNTITFAQNAIKELKPSHVQPLNLSNEGAARFKSDYQLFQKVAEKVS